MKHLQHVSVCDGSHADTPRIRSGAHRQFRHRPQNSRRRRVRETHCQETRQRAAVRPDGTLARHKRSQDLGAPFCPEPVHYRLRNAYVAAIEEQGSISDGVIAKRLNVRRETVCRWRRRNPALRQWLANEIRAEVAQARPFVDMRVTVQAMRGSPEHQKLFYQYVERVGQVFPEGEPGPSGAGPSMILNLLVPRPEIPTIPGVVVRELCQQPASVSGAATELGISGKALTPNPPHKQTKSDCPAGDVIRPKTLVATQEISQLVIP
jgi:hypothetical protein